MYLVILDTNMLVYLCQPDKSESKWFTALFSNSGLFRVVVPQQAVIEWNRIKNNMEQHSNRTMFQPLQTMFNQLPNMMREGKDYTTLLSILEGYQKHFRREFRYVYGTKFRYIDDSLKAEIIIQPNLSDERKIHIAELAINRERPFFCSTDPSADQHKTQKNEADDAAVFFSAIDYANKFNTLYEKVYFVSGNKNEYSIHGNPKIMHPELLKHIEFDHFSYSISLPEVLTEIAPSLQPDQNERERASINLGDDYFCTCRAEGCDEEVHLNADGYYGNFGWWYQRCPTCGFEWKTGDRIEDNYN